MLHDLQKRDLQFKQIYQGLPKDRSVNARDMNTTFSLTHKGKFSFSKPAEIQYELRRKHVD